MKMEMEIRQLSDEVLDQIAQSIIDTGEDVYSVTQAVTEHRQAWLNDADTEYISLKLKGQKINYNLDTVCNSLQGTCMDDVSSIVNSHYPGHDDSNLTEDQLSYISQEIFQCDECGWWCETSNVGWCGEGCNEGEDHGNICGDCHEQYEHEEE